MKKDIFEVICLNNNNKKEIIYIQASNFSTVEQRALKIPSWPDSKITKFIAVTSIKKITNKQNFF